MKSSPKRGLGQKIQWNFRYKVSIKAGQPHLQFREDA